MADHPGPAGAAAVGVNPGGTAGVPHAHSDDVAGTQTYLDAPTGEDGKDGEESEREGFWGRLVPLTGGARQIELRNDKSEYSFGRGKDQDVRLSDIHISSRHCKVYRESLPADPSISPAVYVVDTSANGTFVNKLRLEKGAPRVLNPGDQLSLVVPAKDANSSFASFVFQQLPQSVVQEENRRRTTSTMERKVADYYDIREVLGSGSYAEVRKAVEHRTGIAYAIKIIDKRRFQMVPGFDMNNLLREAEVLSKLKHPNIISLKDIFQTDATLYLVTELVTGGELFDRLVTAGAYPEADARLLFHHLLLAVKYLHDRNIVHRDLKPENILLKSKEAPTEIKVADFGVAKTLGLEGLKTYCGSPQYFAPEVLRRRDTEFGLGRYGKGADMWSLGVILYVVLAAAPPFRESQLQAQVERIQITFRGKVWATVSDDAKDLIMRLLATDTRARFTCDEALAHPWLADLADGDGDGPTGAGAGGAKGRASRRDTSETPPAVGRAGAGAGAGAGTDKEEEEGGGGVAPAAAAPGVDADADADAAEDAAPPVPPHSTSRKKQTRKRSAATFASTQASKFAPAAGGSRGGGGDDGRGPDDGADGDAAPTSSGSPRRSRRRRVR